MTTSLLTTGVRWLWGHKPDLVIVLIILIATVWLTIQVNNFSYRIARIEDVVIDIHERQLPEMRRKYDDEFKKIDEKFNRIDERFRRMDERFDRIDQKFEEIDKKFVDIDVRFQRVERDIVEIKLSVKKIDTYLGTKNKDYKGEE